MIDDENEHPWPEEVLRAVERFKQGDVIERPPFFYATAARNTMWGPPRHERETGTEIEVVELDPADGPPYGIITTQTCDLNEQSDEPRQPWIQIAPVFRMENLDQGRGNQIERFRVGHLVRLTGRTFQDDFWVADLRIQMPLEKSCLVGRDPIEGFDDELRYLRFADHLARRLGRPALADVLSVDVVGQLRRRLNRAGSTIRERIDASVFELRLEADPNRLDPTSARLIVIVRGKPVPEDVESWFDEWWEAQQATTEAKGIALLANKYATHGELTDAEYRRSAELDFRHLRPDE